MKFLLDADSQRKAVGDRRRAADDQGRRGRDQGPEPARWCRRRLAKATGFQLYLDQAYPPAVGQQVNDSVAELVAGQDAEQVVKDITKVAKSQYAEAHRAQ